MEKSFHASSRKYRVIQGSDVVNEKLGEKIKYFVYFTKQGATLHKLQIPQFLHFLLVKIKSYRITLQRIRKIACHLKNISYHVVWRKKRTKPFFFRTYNIKNLTENMELFLHQKHYLMKCLYKNTLLWKKIVPTLIVTSSHCRMSKLCMFFVHS